MTLADVFLARTHRRISELEPAVRAAVVQAFAIIRDSVIEAAVVRLIERGLLDQLIDAALMDRALLATRVQLRHTVERAFRYTTLELPKAGKVNGVVSVMFDQLNPRVIENVRAIDTIVMNTLASDIRATVRQAVESGLRDRVALQKIARGLRDVIGLTPAGETATRNFTAALESGDVAKALRYELRDKRFDSTVARIANGEPLSARQRDTMTSAYRRKFIANNAETVAKTLTVDAYKRGQRLSWESALERGIVPDGYVLMKQWMHTPQEHPRLTHLALDRSIVPFNQRYANGDLYPGEFDPWGCKCAERVFLAHAA